MGQDLHTLTISESSALIHSGTLSPVDLVEACLTRIEVLNPTLNAFLHVMGADAREEAQNAESAIKRGEDWGPLHGIPIGVKDLIDVAGEITTAGSDFFREERASEDAVVIQQLRAAGAIILGKTHLHEFAIGATNVNPHYGPTRNPWNPALSPGGSSGGSGAAVAAGLCPGALGTDTGGSVRVPSALCGLTGLRPATGQVSTRGVVPMSWTLDTVGPMARTARDVAILLEAMQHGSPPPYTARINNPVSGLRIGLPTDAFFWQDTSIEVVAAVRQAVEQLVDLGMVLVDVALPGIATAQIAASVISLGDAAAFHRDRLESEPGRFGADVRARLEWGMARSAADYARARQTARAWRHTVRGLFRKQIDILALPTTPVPAQPIVGSEGIAAARQMLRFTYPISLSELPALSAPCGFTEEHLPVGLQLVAPEAGPTLRAAHAYQQATGWHKQTPNT